MLRTFALITLLAIPGTALAGALPAPDDIATPGAVKPKAMGAAPVAAEWAETPRRISKATLREVARRYGIALTPDDPLGVHDSSCGEPRCEIDHRIPHGCGGADSAENLSYQTAGAWQAKDRLGHWAEKRVKLVRMSLAECQTMFGAPNDWRVQYRITFREEPPNTRVAPARASSLFAK